MNLLTSVTLASAVLLSACASPTPDSQTTQTEERYVPLGTLIARKTPAREDNVKFIDKQALENDRNMGSGVLDGRH